MGPYGPAPKDCGVLVTPFHVLLGNAPLSTLLNIHPQYLLPNTSLPHWLLILLPPWHLGTWPHPNSDNPPPARLYCQINQKPSQSGPEEPSNSKRRDEMPLHKVLTGVWQEAFAMDSDLVQKVREDHYKRNCPHFNC